MRRKSWWRRRRRRSVPAGHAPSWRLVPYFAARCPLACAVVLKEF